MPFALAVLARGSLPFRLCACFEELAELHHLSMIKVQRRIDAVRLIVAIQVRLKVKSDASVFGCS